jgi:hypothetical protein
VSKRLVLPLLALAAAAAVLAVGAAVGAGAHGRAAASCPKAWAASWQRLANRIHAPVYCPSWLPDPLTGQIGGKWNIIDSVARDRSYLIGFAWQEMGQEIHVNLRGYPGVTKVPTCRETNQVDGKTQTIHIPCFSDPHPPTTIAGLRVTEYTVNQDADMWHVLYAWTYNRSLYTISQHISLPLTFPMVVRDLKQELAGLVLIKPA